MSKAMKMTEKTAEHFEINDDLVESPDGVLEDPDRQLERLMNEGHMRRWMEEHPMPKNVEPAEREDPDAQVQRLMAEGRARRAAEQVLQVQITNPAPVQVSVQDPLDVRISNALLVGIGFLSCGIVSVLAWIVATI